MPALNSTVVKKQKQQNDLNSVEVRVLNYLAQTLKPGFCPSRQELSQAAGLGSRGSSITTTLRQLEQKGYLELGPGRTRSITLHRTADGKRFANETVRVPVAGQTAAETPRSGEIASNPVSDAIELARSMLGGREDVYALRIHDRRYSDALVNPGDVVVLARTNEIANGEMSFVEIADPRKGNRRVAMLKYYYRENGHVRLQPAHPDMPPVYYKPEEVVVKGRVVLVIRQFA